MYFFSVTCRRSVFFPRYSGFLPVILIFHHHNHGLDMTLAVAGALSPNKLNLKKYNFWILM